jgi:hypothetical protein
VPKEPHFSSLYIISIYFCPYPCLTSIILDWYCYLSLKFPFLYIMYTLNSITYVSKVLQFSVNSTWILIKNKYETAHHTCINYQPTMIAPMRSSSKSHQIFCCEDFDARRKKWLLYSKFDTDKHSTSTLCSVTFSSDVQYICSDINSNSI